MAERFSIVGVYPDGRRTTLLVNAARDEATLIAVGMEQGCPEFVRIDVVPETPKAPKRKAVPDGYWSPKNAPERRRP